MYQLFYILVHKSLFFWSKTETFNALQIVRQLGDIQLLGMLCACIGLLQFVELKFIHGCTLPLPVNQAQPDRYKLHIICHTEV